MEKGGRTPFRQKGDAPELHLLKLRPGEGEYTFPSFAKEGWPSDEGGVVRQAVNDHPVRLRFPPLLDEEGKISANFRRLRTINR